MLPTKIDIDPILEEIHQTRRRIAEKFGYDIAAIVRDAQERQAASGWPVWQGPAAKVEERADQVEREIPS